MGKFHGWLSSISNLPTLVARGASKSLLHAVCTDMLPANRFSKGPVDFMEQLVHVSDPLPFAECVLTRGAHHLISIAIHCGCVDCPLGLRDLAHRSPAVAKQMSSNAWMIGSHMFTVMCPHKFKATNAVQVLGEALEFVPNVPVLGLVSVLAYAKLNGQGARDLAGTICRGAEKLNMLIIKEPFDKLGMAIFVAFMGELKNPLCNPAILSLEGSHIGRLGPNAIRYLIAEVVPTFPRLGYLNLADNALNDICAQTLVTSAPPGKINLKGLGLNNNDLTKHSAGPLSMALGAQPQLEEVKLNDNKFKFEGVKTFLPVLQNLKSLMRVSFVNVGLSDRDKLLLKKQFPLPHVKVYY